MKHITIDCSAIENKEQLHDAFSEALCFPAHYGRNLDALHDCLTGITGPTRISLPGFRDLGPFARGFRLVLEDAEAENGCLIVEIL